MKFEFIALIATSKKIEWLRNILLDISYDHVVKQLYLGNLIKFIMKNLDMSTWHMNIYVN